jgi:hypothetical protein
MIYTLPYQSEELLKPKFFSLRDKIDAKSDVIHLTVTHSSFKNRTKADIYKAVLKLDGKYRTERSKWKSPPIKIRVINHM